MAKLVYEGSVKNLWEVSSDQLDFEYTDAYSIFDWGRMPDSLSHKGESLAVLGEFFFRQAGAAETWRRAELRRSNWLAPFTGRLREVLDAEITALERDGLKHHFLRRAAPNRLTVRRVAALGPVEHKIGGQTLYHYSGCGWEKRVRLIPLEVKRATRIGPYDLRGLTSFLEAFGDRARFGVVLYSGEDAVRASERIVLVPIARALLHREKTPLELPAA